MVHGHLTIVEDIKRLCADLSGHAVEGAHYLINHPEQVAFHSMREIARRAEVPPVSLVRLAQRLGLAGYGELRRQFIDAMHDRRQRDRLSTSRNEESARALIERMGEGTALNAFVDSFFEAELAVVRQARSHLSDDRLTEAADLLSLAPKVFVAGRRTAFTPAFTLAYTLRKARPGVILLDGPGGAPEGMLEDIAPGDVFVAVTFAPFNRVVHRLAERAAVAGARIVAITDSFAAPVGGLAGRLNFVAQTSGQAFPESALGAIAVANLLAALAISRLGDVAQNRIRENERFLVGSGEYLLPDTGQRKHRPGPLPS